MSHPQSYSVNLRAVQRQDTALRLTLDDDFFAAVDQDEILGGQLDVLLRVRHGAADTYTFRYTAEGHVRVACDRCLDPVSIPIALDETVKVRQSDDEDADGDITLIPYAQFSYDITWDLYELIALNLPLRRIHPDGGCNADMLSRFSIEQDSGEGFDD